MPAIPRAPHRVPILGHIPALNRDPFGLLTSLRDIGDIVRVDLAGLPVHFVTSHDLAYDVLVTQARNYHKGRFFVRAEDAVGQGLVTANGARHRAHRRLMQPAFHRQRIAAYTATMTAHAERMAGAWQPDDVIDVPEQAGRLAMAIIGDCLFATDMGPAADTVRLSLPILAKGFLTRAVLPPALDRLPINRPFDRAARQVRAAMGDVISARRAEGRDGDDLLAMLLSARDADTGEALTDAEAEDELIQLAVAGTETPAVILAWALHEIGTHPDVEATLLAELDCVLAGRRRITVEDIARLTYMRRVIDETLRLYGVPMLMRRTIAPVEIAGIEFPADTEVALSPYALQRDSRVFTNPDRFEPDRPKETFLPFGAGTRKCIGDAFAMTSITVTLATILTRWRLQPASGHTPRKLAGSMPVPDRLPMTAVPRSGRTSNHPTGKAPL